MDTFDNMIEQAVSEGLIPGSNPARRKPRTQNPTLQKLIDGDGTTHDLANILKKASPAPINYEYKNDYWSRKIRGGGIDIHFQAGFLIRN